MAESSHFEESSKNAKRIRLGSVSDSDSDFSLPNLEARSPKGKSLRRSYEAGMIVWIISKAEKWPGFVNIVYPKDQKASVFFINCEQTLAIKVPFTRLKPITDLNYLDIYFAQRLQSPAICQAMQCANDYRVLKERGKLTETPNEFFARKAHNQACIISDLLLPNVDHIPDIIDEDDTDEEEKQEDKDNDEQEEEDDDIDLMRSNSIEVSESSLSKREQNKLLSASKARHSDNTKFVKYIKSKPCIKHLQEICLGKVASERHQLFKESMHLPHFWLGIIQTHNTGLEFFGSGSVMVENLILFLKRNFMEQEMQFDVEEHLRIIYCSVVLLPEALKQALRSIKKTPEDKLEKILVEGLFQTPTERKAKRLAFD